MFLMNALITRTRSLSPEQKTILNPLFKAALDKLPISTVGNAKVITSERERLLTLLYLGAINLRDIPNPLSSSPEHPPLAKDPFPSLDEALSLAIGVVDFCLGEREKSEKEEGDRGKKREEGVREVDRLVEQLLSLAMLIFSPLQRLFWAKEATRQTLAHTLRESFTRLTGPFSARPMPRVSLFRGLSFIPFRSSLWSKRS